MTVKYYIDKPNGTKPTAIYLIAKIDGSNIKFNTRFKVRPENWSQEKQEVIKSHNGKGQLNNILRTRRNEVELIHRQLIMDSKKLDLDEFRSRAKTLFDNTTTEAGVKNFWHVYDEYISNGRLKKRESTVKTYQTLKNHLKNFEIEKNYKLSFSRIDHDFKDKFHDYLIEVPKLSDSSIHKNFQILKAFMTFSARKKYHENFDYKQFSFKRNPKEQVSLSKDELEKLRTLDLQENNRLIKIRDMFLFQCLTSLRWSDMINLEKVNIKEKKIGEKRINLLEAISIKTGGKIRIPLTKEAFGILNKYDEENKSTCFPQISSQKYNSYLKEVCQLAGIDDLVQIIEKSGRTQKKTEFRKYELIASHTGRRTFITLFVEDGGTMAECMLYTGHTSMKELLTYWKRSAMGDMNLMMARIKGAQY